MNLRQRLRKNTCFSPFFLGILRNQMGMIGLNCVEFLEFPRKKEKTKFVTLSEFDVKVDWYPWGEEAFAEARRRDVPIFLSSKFSPPLVLSMSYSLMISHRLD